MEFKELVKERYSCKGYKDTPVEKEKILGILEAGRMAPTAKNLQEHKVYVIQSEEGLNKVDQLTPCRYGAPAVLMVCWDKNNTYEYPGGSRDSGEEDACIVASHLMLGAKNAGLDSCWLNSFDPQKAKQLFNLPENLEVLMFLDLGYPKDNMKPLPNHFSRKPLEETTEWI